MENLKKYQEIAKRNHGSYAGINSNNLFEVLISSLIEMKTANDSSPTAPPISSITPSTGLYPLLSSIDPSSKQLDQCIQLQKTLIAIKQTIIEKGGDYNIHSSVFNKFVIDFCDLFFSLILKE